MTYNCLNSTLLSSIIALLLSLGTLNWSQAQTDAPSPETPQTTAASDIDLPALIGSRLEGLKTNKELDNKETIYLDHLARSFYNRRNNTPNWFYGKYIPPYTEDFVQCILEAKNNGLLPKDYHYDAIQKVLKKIAVDAQKTDINEFIRLEIMLTDSYLLLSKHYLQGKVKPDSLMNWHHKGRFFDLVKYLEESSKAKDYCYSLERLLPIHPEYRDLKNMLRTYRQLSWKALPASPGMYLQKNDKHPLIPAIRKRLQMTGDLKRGNTSDEFDREFQNAVLTFQRRNGMTEKGAIDLVTMDMLNTASNYRVKQIKANMERWRWMPDDLGHKYIWINAPSFELKMVENGEIAYEERVIVGLRMFPTPCFSDSLRFMVFNPYWYIPKSIAQKELIPEIMEDTSYLRTHDIVVFYDGKKVDNPQYINWRNVDLKKQPYNFRHGSNDFNPMGRVKFMFPNRYSVYLHDTNNRDLFSNSFRAHSHGCVRLRNPFKFAEYVLNAPRWNQTAIKQQVESTKRKQVDLKYPIPIHITYATAFIDNSGKVNFREDLYKFDERVYKHLTTPIKALLEAEEEANMDK